ncbi:MAG: hypothetical protein GY822_11590 [Deltaproteobacteria bacterium]|nr:hypothetical protein [Deltaproteobacteria bacterium]
MTSTFYHIPYSPWSLRALRALEHHEVFPSLRIYTPFVSEREMRAAMNEKHARVTVPVWLVDDEVLSDSWTIAKHAEQTSNAAKLFPAEFEKEVLEANRLSDQILDPARSRSLVRVLKNPLAVKEALPRSLGRIPIVSSVVGKSVLQKFCAKYGIQSDDYDSYGQKARDGLESLRTLVKRARAEDRLTLLPSFSYADITLGLSLQLLRPPLETPLKKESRKASTDDELCEEFADLLQWRDELHEEFGLLPRRQKRS